MTDLVWTSGEAPSPHAKSSLIASLDSYKPLTLARILTVWSTTSSCACNFICLILYLLPQTFANIERKSCAWPLYNHVQIIITKLLTHIKQGRQQYCETAYSRSGLKNQMWILNNSLLVHLKSPNFNLITNIKSFDFSTLYTTIPHQKLKSRLATIIWNSFLHKNGNRRYKYLVLGREGPFFVKEHSDLKNKYTEEDITNLKMLEILVDNIFVVFAG